MDLAFACVGGQTSLGFVCIRPDMTWRSIHLVFVWGIEVDLFLCGWSKLTRFLSSAGSDVYFVWVLDIDLFLVRAENDLVFMWVVEIDIFFVCGPKMASFSCGGSKKTWFSCRWSKVT